MLLTEKEAQTGVICPMMQRSGDPERTCCYGSGCAVWRWAEPPKMLRAHSCDDATATVEPEVRPFAVPADWEFSPYDVAEGGPAAWVEPVEQAQARRRGYCGLAGKPEER